MNCLTASLIFASLALAYVQSHELYVLNSPQFVKINQSTIHTTELAEIISSVLGFTVPHGLKTWSNLLVADPLSLPEAVVVLEIPGLKNPGFDLNKVEHHELILDESLAGVYSTVKQTMEERLGNRDYSVIHGSLTNEEFLKTEIFHPNFKLNPSITPHNTISYDEKYKVFFDEIYYLQQLGQGIKEKVLANNMPDFHWFQLQGVKALVAVHDPNSKDAINNIEVLNEAISTLVQSYNEIFNNQVLFIAITNDGVHAYRRKRQVDSVEANLNVAEPVSSDYPIIFNILLWFTVIFVFSLLATALSISQMDPGRDSIIYRMTSNRMKKEN